MHDVVYPVKATPDGNEELRYSLRSLVNLPHRRVFIIGDRPKWCVNVIHAASPQTGPELSNVNAALKLVANTEALSDDFVYMNDDFFIMRPTDKIEPGYQMELLDRIDIYKRRKKWLQAYSLITTRKRLVELGLIGLKSYELHTPMMLNKANLRAMYELCADMPLFAIRPKTMYGNLYNISGVQTDDVKNPIEDTQEAHATKLYLSTDEDTFAHSTAGELIRTKFPNPCAYEIEGAAIPTAQPRRENQSDRQRDSQSRV